MGRLSTADPDKGQSYIYTLLDGARGRFKIQGDIVKVIITIFRRDQFEFLLLLRRSMRCLEVLLQTKLRPADFMLFQEYNRSSTDLLFLISALRNNPTKPNVGNLEHKETTSKH